MDCDNFPTMRTMAGHIPSDLLIDILARLPVASLLRFRSVCKSWCALITSPSFVTKHLNQSITNSKRKGDKLLVTTIENNRKLEPYLLLRDDERFGYEYTEFEFPFKHLVGYSRIVGCCNGLVCLSHVSFSVNPQVILWNPSIRKSVTLPIPRDLQWSQMVVYGFGAHPTTHQYKVVRIDYERSFMRNSYKIPPKAEIYEQGTRSWRGVSSAAPPYYILNFRNCISQAFLNGAVHWVASDGWEDSTRNLIISFNMASESFSEIMLPPTLADDQFPFSLCIKLFGELLAVSCSGRRDGGVGSIWVMKEYGVAESWTKLFSSSLLGMRRVPLGFRRNGDVLLASADNYDLSSYVPGTKTLRDTGIKGISPASYVGPFIETLVLTEKINGVSQGQLNFREALLPTSEEMRE